MIQDDLKAFPADASRHTVDNRQLPITEPQDGSGGQSCPEGPVDLDNLPALMSQKFLASLFGVSERKLERDRHEGHGVRFTKIGRRVVYRRDDVLAFLEQNTHQSTAEAKAKLRS